MGMQSYANQGYLVPVSKINEFDKIPFEIRKALLESDKEWHPSNEDSSEFSDFANSFVEHYGMFPQFITIDDECGGFSGDVEIGHFIYLHEDDKYIKTIRYEWTQLPFAPEISSWTSFG